MGASTSPPNERRIVLITQSEPKPPSSWDRIEQIGRIVSLAAIPVAIPIALAIYGSITQNALQKQTISRDYVQIAVSILKEKEADPALRGWAADLLAADSPTKIPDELQAKLRGGEVKLPTLGDMVGSQDLYTISPDRAYMAVVSLNDPSKIRVFELATKREVAGNSFPSKGDRIVAMAFSPDSHLLAAASLNAVVVMKLGSEGTDFIVYSLRSYSISNGLRDPKSISVSNDEQVSVVDGSTVYTWDKQRRLHRDVFRIPESNVDQQP